jgi:hypothetical protein
MTPEKIVDEWNAVIDELDELMIEVEDISIKLDGLAQDATDKLFDFEKEHNLI